MIFTRCEAGVIMGFPDISDPSVLVKGIAIAVAAACALPALDRLKDAILRREGLGGWALAAIIAILAAAAWWLKDANFGG
jgi:hypothetical protein